jgi:hypothetical protein
MTDKTPIHYGWFQARYLPPLKPFVDHARAHYPLHFHKGAIGLEPCEAGGAWLYAVTGCAMAIIHDREARIDAPVTLDLPDAAFAAARMPEPVRMSFCGEQYECPLPEWAQPDSVYVYSAGMHIATKMRNPCWAEEDEEFQPCLYSCTAMPAGHHRRGQDFRMSEGAPADWRRALKSCYVGEGNPVHSINFNPAVADLFSGFAELLVERGQFPNFIHTVTRGTSPNPAMVTVRIPELPEFLGGYMPQKDVPALPPIPAHFFHPAATHHDVPDTPQ